MTDEHMSAFPSITELTRREIVEFFLLRRGGFAGRISEMEFLGRVWPLDKMPSSDRRFATARADIETHYIGFHDWDTSELLLGYFNLAEGPVQDFIRLIEYAVHPLVLATEEDVRSLVAELNTFLRRDGVELALARTISGRSIYLLTLAGGIRAEVEPTGWERVDRQLVALRTALTTSKAVEDYQGVGHLGRELMISLAQAVITPAEAASADGVVPSQTDANRLLEAYIGQRLPGSGSEHLRRAVRAVVTTTNAVTHDRSAESIDAALCTELVTASVQLIRIIDQSAMPPPRSQTL